MIDDETFREWLKRGLLAMRKGSQNRGNRRLLQVFAEFFFAIFLFSFGVAVTLVLIPPLAIVVCIVTVAIILHAFYLLEHPIYDP